MPLIDAGVTDVKAGVQWEWVGAGADGLACDLHSPGFKVLVENTKRVVGHCQPMSDTVLPTASLTHSLAHSLTRSLAHLLDCLLLRPQTSCSLAFFYVCGLHACVALCGAVPCVVLVLSAGYLAFGGRFACGRVRHPNDRVRRGRRIPRRRRVRAHQRLCAGL
jgi:hypothetical protein